MAQGKHVCNICGKSVKLKTHINEHPECTIRDYFKLFIDPQGGSCSSCASETTIDWRNKRFYKTCGSKPCLAQRFEISSREYQTNRWINDEAYRNLMKKVSSKTMTKLMQDPSFGGNKFKVTSESLKKKWKEKSYRNVQSTRAYIQNKDQNSNFGKPFSGWCEYKDINFRSRWEKDFAQKMDEVGIKWEYEPRSFSYISSKGVQSYYLVDFYLPDLKLYVEIKSSYFMDEETEIKLQAVRNEGYEIILFNENKYDIITKGEFPCPRLT